MKSETTTPLGVDAGHGDSISFFISPLGDDSWSGTLPDPNGPRTDGPFATPGRAQAAARKSGKRRPIRVLLRGGTYWLDQPLVFTAADSGTAEAPVTYAAFRGEKPILSGGRPLAGWKAESRDGVARWTLRVPEIAAGPWSFTQLFVDGHRHPRARLPKTGFYYFGGMTEEDRARDNGECWFGVSAVHFAGDDLRPWSNLPDVEIIVPLAFLEEHLRITEVDGERRIVRFRAKTKSRLLGEKGLGNRYYVENVREALTEPGEWYLDRASGELTYLPLPGEDPSTTEVIAPRLKELVVFGGAETRERVRHVRLENLDFRHSEWRLPPDHVGSHQAHYDVPAAIRFAHAEDCALYGCSVSRISQYAVEVETGSRRNRIVGCAFFDLGAGGVKIDHDRPDSTGAISDGMLVADRLGATRAEQAAAAAEERHSGRRPPFHSQDGEPGARTLLSDCTIHDGGKIFHSACGVWIGDSGFNRVCHNHIYNLYYTGISIGWTWSFLPTDAVGNRIEYNHIHHIGRGLLSDMGGIYTLGDQSGTILRGNHIHDVECYDYLWNIGNGIYLDHSSSFLRLEENVVYRTSNHGFFLNAGRDNVVRNNVFAYSGGNQFRLGQELYPRPCIFEGNILAYQKGGVLGTSWRSPIRSDRNLYWNEPRPPTSFNRLSFAEWQQLGFDARGRVADPLFRDPAGGDFSLRDGSPALDLGVKPIDVSKAGPRFRGWMPESIDAWPEPASIAKPIIACWLEPYPPPFERDQATAFEMESLPSTLLFRPGETIRVRLTGRNCSGAPAAGSLPLRMLAKGSAHIEGPSAMDFNLRPGEQTAAIISVQTFADTEQVLLVTEPSDAGMVPVSVCFFCQDEGVIPTVPAGQDLEALPAALRSRKPLPVGRPLRLGELRLALCGDNLALVADVRDQARRPDAAGKKLSWLHLYAALADSDKIGQVRIEIADEFRAAAVSRLQDKAWSAVEHAAVQCLPEPAGYSLAALIPLACLGLAPGCTKLKLEVLLSATPAPGREPVLAQLGWCTQPQQGTTGYWCLRK